MNTEQKICLTLVRKLLADGYDPADIHEEVVVVLNGQTVSADIVALRDGEITVIEAKDHLDEALVRQCLRWQGSADWIIGVSMEPRGSSQHQQRRRATLRRYGIGIYYVGATTGEMVPLMRGDQHTLMVKPKKQSDVSHDLILSSLASVRGPMAGSAGVKRVRPDKWDEVRKVLAGEEATLKWLKSEVRHLTPGDWREFQKAVRAGDVAGVEADPHASPLVYRICGVRK